MAAINKDIVLVVSLVLSVVSLVLLFGVTWYFQSSLDLLQQQVEYDRELLFKLQEQINVKDNDDTINKHDVVKRQSQQTCHCKDGNPGPQGPPGNKGEIGMEGKQGRKGDTGPPGPRGDVGDRGPRGILGDTGPPGPKGDTGDQGSEGNPGSRGPRGKRGNTGARGNAGPKGENGVKGNTGSKGENGVKGIKGDTGQKGYPGDKGLKGDIGSRGPIGETGLSGIKGEQGIKGDKGDTGPTGTKGEMGFEGMKGNKGKKGTIGLPGSTGLTGPKGAPGGEKRNGGTVYVRWGHDQCPSTAQLVYSGRAGGSHFNHQGGGSNPQCLPMDPNFLRGISGNQHWRALMYGAEYETRTDSNSHVHGRDAHDVPCAVCHVSNRTADYMVPAKYTCPTGWTREYYGYLMSSLHGIGRYRTQFTCVDTALKSVNGSSAYHLGFLFMFVEGRCGSLPCPPYDNYRELSCAVCTK